MKKRVLLNIIIFTAAFFVVGSCNEKKANTATNNTEGTAKKLIDDTTVASIKKASKLLQDGDLVMRSDNDFESLTLQNFSDSDRTYSHSGIAFKEGENFIVYHAMTGIENPSGLCRKDPFDSFVSPLQKTGFGIFRYQLSETEKEKFHAIVKENIAKKIPFDLTFNLKTNDSLYCSEMIYKGLKLCSNGRIVLPNSVLNNFTPKILGYKYNQAFFKKFEYISLDNLYLNPFCKEITRVKYQ
jgi:hypothetical protein